MLRRLIEVRMLIALAIAAGVGIGGLRAFPIRSDQVFLAVIEARHRDMQVGQLSVGQTTADGASSTVRGLLPQSRGLVRFRSDLAFFQLCQATPCRWASTSFVHARATSPTRPTLVPRVIPTRVNVASAVGPRPSAFHEAHHVQRQWRSGVCTDPSEPGRQSQGEAGRRGCDPAPTPLVLVLRCRDSPFMACS
jgi:hypothetical protein